MNTSKRFALAAVLLSILLLPGSTPAQSAAQCPAPVPPRLALAWELEAPSLGISWHGSLALDTAETTAPMVEHRPAPAVEWKDDAPRLVDEARRALRLVQAVLQLPAALLAMASRYLF